MKIYLSHKEPLDTAYNHCSNLASLENTSLDGEVTDLVIDSFLSCFSYGEVLELVKIILKKCRINCQVTIIEADCNILFRQYTRGEIELDYFNTLFFDASKKCILNTQKILDLIPQNFTIEEKLISNSVFSVVKLRRTK